MRPSFLNNLLFEKIEHCIFERQLRDTQTNFLLKYNNVAELNQVVWNEKEETAGAHF